MVHLGCRGSCFKRALLLLYSTIHIFRCCLSPSSGQKGEMSHPSLVCDSQTSSYIQQVCGVLASMLLASGICQTGPNSQGNMISADLTIAGELDTGSMKWIDERQVINWNDPAKICVGRWSFFVGRRFFFLWQPTIIGSQCQLVLSHWLPSVLQTNNLSRFWLGHSS